MAGSSACTVRASTTRRSSSSTRARRVSGIGGMASDNGNLAKSGQSVRARPNDIHYHPTERHDTKTTCRAIIRVPGRSVAVPLRTPAPMPPRHPQGLVIVTRDLYRGRSLKRAGAPPPDAHSRDQRRRHQRARSACAARDRPAGRGPERRGLGFGAGDQPIRHRSFAVAERADPDARSQRARLRGARHADRQRADGRAPRPAQRHAGSGAERRQPRRQHGRGRDLFRHRRRRLRGHAARHPLDRPVARVWHEVARPTHCNGRRRSPTDPI